MRTRSLWREGNFVRLWTGETISAFGSAITGFALPLVAVVSLDVSASEMGILKALQSLPVLLFSLIIGVWIDRVRRRPLLVLAQFGQAVLLAVIPLAAATGYLRIELLYIVGFLVGTLSLVFALASTSFFPSIVDRDDLLEGNAKLQVSRSTASVAGPGLAGFLVERITAPLAIALDSISFICSGLCLLFIRSSERVRAQREKTDGLMREIGEGINLVVRHALLFSLTLGTTLASLGGAIQSTVLTLFLVRQLMIGPAWLGIVGSSAGLAAVLGSFLAVPLARRFGPGPVLIFTTCMGGIGMGLIPFAGSMDEMALPMVIFAHVLIATGFSI